MGSGGVKCVRHHCSIPCSTWGLRSSSDTSVKISRQSQLCSVFVLANFWWYFCYIPSVRTSRFKASKNPKTQKGNIFGSKYISLLLERSQRRVEQHKHPLLRQMPPQRPSSVICSFHPCASDRKGRGSVDEHKADSSPSDSIFMNYFVFSVNVKCFSWLYLKPSAPMRAALLGSIYLFARVSVFPGALSDLSGSWGSAQRSPSSLVSEVLEVVRDCCMRNGSVLLFLEPNCSFICLTWLLSWSSKLSRFSWHYRYFFLHPSMLNKTLSQGLQCSLCHFFFLIARLEFEIELN